MRQPPVKGGRTAVNSAFLREVERAVEKEMRRWNVSRSYVIAVAVAFALGVEEQPDYKRGNKASVLTMVPGGRQPA